jgi:hypothetical protein
MKATVAMPNGLHKLASNVAQFVALLQQGGVGLGIEASIFYARMRKQPLNGAQLAFWDATRL